MALSEPLQRIDEQGWRCGLANLLRQENQRWWHTRRWWVQSLVMALLLNGFLAFGLWIVPLSSTEELPPQLTAGTFDVILIWMSIFTVLDALFTAQSAIISDKQSGVAAWILSGPVSRSAFILSKFIGNAIGLVATTIALQGVLAYLQMSLRDERLLPVFPIAAVLGLQALYMLFYLALALMLGCFFSGRMPVLAISFGVLIGQPFIDRFAENYVPWLAWVLPAKLPELVRFMHRAEPLPSMLPILVVLLSIIGFLCLAIWRFRREEF